MEKDYKNKIITIPNLLSMFRILLIPIIVWIYCVKENWLIAGAVLILSGVTDFVDGIIARRFNMISDLGKILDPVADKLTQGVMLVCLCINFPCMLIPLIVMVIKELCMAVSGVLVIKKNGEVHGADFHGKVSTWVLYITMILHIFWANIPTILSNILIILCASVILISFALYGKSYIRVLKGRE